MSNRDKQIVFTNLMKSIFDKIVIRIEGEICLLLK
jgi:hypothetical protein